MFLGIYHIFKVQLHDSSLFFVMLAKDLFTLFKKQLLVLLISYTIFVFYLFPLIFLISFFLFIFGLIFLIFLVLWGVKLIQSFEGFFGGGGLRSFFVLNVGTFYFELPS